VLLDLLRLAAGVTFLYFGAEWLVRGAAGLARAYGVRPLVIGLTVVAYGTSAPELAVSGLAAFEGKSEIALGNVIGSNIANIGLILGLSALISPPGVDPTLIRREVPALLVATLLIPAFLWSGEIGRVEGGLLVLGAAAFTVLTLRAAAKVPAGEFRGDVAAEVEQEAGQGSRPRLALIALVGLAVLLAGGKVFVDGAVNLALAVGMSERLVGLTVVAIGTSLPELAASLMAATRGHSELAVGNVVGSNIFNALLILGGASLVRPISADVWTLRLDLAVMVAFGFGAALLLRGARRLRRAEGAVLVLAYLGFLAALAS
jgi:cation:H+ antiporter